MEAIAYDFGLSFFILQSGDVEVNPGPKPGTNQPSAAKPQDKGAGNKESDKYTEELTGIRTTLSSMSPTLEKILSPLDNYEQEMALMKDELSGSGKKQALFEKEIVTPREDIYLNCNAMHEFEFNLDRQEQYSRKKSVCSLGVVEEKEENVEEKSVAVLESEIGVTIRNEEIDIVQRVKRYQEGKPRPILILTKENIMRKRKEAKGIKIVEDLAFRVRNILTYLNARRRELNLECVWMIDGKVKYKYFNFPRSFEIRSYLD